MFGGASSGGPIQMSFIASSIADNFLSLLYLSWTTNLHDLPRDRRLKCSIIVWQIRQRMLCAHSRGCKTTASESGGTESEAGERHRSIRFLFN